MKQASLLALTLVLVAASSPAQDEPGTRNFSYPKYLMLPAAAFATTGAEPDSYYLSTEGYITGTSTGEGCVRAPVYFPDGVEIEWFHATFADASTASMTVSLMRTYNWFFEDTQTVATITSGNTGSTDSYMVYGLMSNPAYSTVAYSHYSYYVEACLPDANVRLNQVNIRYAGDEALFDDGFESGNTSAWHYYDNPMTVPAADFRPTTLGSGNVLFHYLDGYLYGGNYNAYRWVVAPVYLPQGAEVTSVIAIIMDNDPGGGGSGACSTSISDVTVSLKKVSRPGNVTTMDTDTTSGAETYPQVVVLDTITEPIVSHPDNTYFLTARICGPKHRIFGARVHYNP